MEWNKTRIELSHSYDNLKNLLNAVYKKENWFSQADFYLWCNQLTVAWLDEDLNGLD